MAKKILGVHLPDSAVWGDPPLIGEPEGMLLRGVGLTIVALALYTVGTYQCLDICNGHEATMIDYHIKTDHILLTLPHLKPYYSPNCVNSTIVTELSNADV